MADKSTILRAFNTHFFDFLNDIINVTDNEEIKVAKTSFELFKRANPTLIIKVWYSKIYSPYKDVISKGNISFFFEKDYSSDLTNVANMKEIMKIIDKIREPIRTLDKTNLELTTKYIQNLSELSLHYNDL
jgi:hypothetical protein